MGKTKSTDELENILRNTKADEIPNFLTENSESLLQDEKPFATYIKTLIKSRGMLQQDVFLHADIPERYGYKLLNEEKRTRQRDIILRICYAARLTLNETQEALKIYGMPQLYAKIPRDALLMVAFNERPGTILDVNNLLKANGMELLRTSGTVE